MIAFWAAGRTLGNAVSTAGTLRRVLTSPAKLPRSKDEKRVIQNDDRHDASLLCWLIRLLDVPPLAQMPETERLCFSLLLRVIYHLHLTLRDTFRFLLGEVSKDDWKQCSKNRGQSQSCSRRREAFEIAGPF